MCKGIWMRESKFYSPLVVWGVFWSNWKDPVSSLPFFVTCVLCHSTAIHVLKTHPDSVLWKTLLTAFAVFHTGTIFFFSSMCQSLEDQAQTPLFLYIISFHLRLTTEFCPTHILPKGKVNKVMESRFYFTLYFYNVKHRPTCFSNWVFYLSHVFFCLDGI